MISKRAIIIGAGNSIRQGLNCSSLKLPIWDKLKNEFTIGINFIHYFFTPTVLLYQDYKFFIAERENLKSVPLIFSSQNDYYAREFKTNRTEQKQILENTYLLPGSSVYQGLNAWEKGFYSRCLSGVFAISLAVACGCNEVFLLGFDAIDINGKTHFYQDEIKAVNKSERGRENSGVGKHENGAFKTNIYNQKINTIFKAFCEELNRIQIYNVSPKSKIDIFPKITYKEFYEKLINEQISTNQDLLRQKLRNLYYEKYY